MTLIVAAAFVLLVASAGPLLFRLLLPRPVSAVRNETAAG